MGIVRYIIALCITAQPVVADISGDLSCHGVLPDWTVSTTGQTGIFTYPDAIAMDIMQSGFAEGSTETRALTLVGGRQSAVVIVTEHICRINAETFDAGVTVLTQRGDTPIILEGCCEIKD